MTSSTSRTAAYSPSQAVPDAERIFNGRDAFALWFSLGIGLLVLQAGALLVPALSLPVALAAIVCGTVLGVGFLAAAGTIGTDTGMAAMASLAPALGRRGAALPAVLNVVQLFGWGAFELIVMRDSADALSRQTFGVAHPLAWTIGFGILATLLAIAGPLSFVRRFLRTWGMWMLLLAAAWLTWDLFVHQPIAALWHRAGSGGMPFGAALDLVIAMPLSWLPLISDYSRFGKRPRPMFIGTVLGYGIANIWFYALGAAYALVANGADDVTRSLAMVGGGLALLLILIDELDNAFVDVHSAAVSAGVVTPRANIAILSLLFGVVITAIASTIPMARYENFLLLLGSVFSPLFGVVLTEHFIINKRRPADQSALPGWRGLPLCAWAIGIASYHLISNYLPSLGATLPSLLIAGLAYGLLRTVGRR